MCCGGERWRLEVIFGSWEGDNILGVSGVLLIGLDPNGGTLSRDMRREPTPVHNKGTLQIGPIIFFPLCFIVVVCTYYLFSYCSNIRQKW